MGLPPPYATKMGRSLLLAMSDEELMGLVAGDKERVKIVELKDPT